MMAEYIDTDLLSVKVIRKQCKTEDYLINDVKAYRGAKAYSEIEHAVDNFLRGYHEAMQDVLDIIDEKHMYRFCACGAVQGLHILSP